MKFGIIGAGFAGMSAALDILKAGHEVSLFEHSDRAGGLAAGFKADHWQWELEHFYHHWFETDDAIIQLIAEIGQSHRLFFPPSITSLYYQNQTYPFGNPKQMLRFLIPKLGLLPTFRYGVTGLYLRFSKNWERLEKETAQAWLIKAMGHQVYDTLWEPLLVGKFGRYHQDVNMAWLWARLHKRSFRLGYFQGGFQALSEAVYQHIKHLGLTVSFQTSVQQILPQENMRLKLVTSKGDYLFDRVISTTSPKHLARMAPDLPETYLKQVNNLTSMGAVVMVLALKHQLTDEHYWINLPKHENFPFLALVEHTNFIDPKYYGGDHVVYCGDYLEPDHPYFSMSKEDLLALFLPTLARFNPLFEPTWVKQSWLFKAPYAQPVPGVNHSQHIPPLQTPIPGLFWASMSQVYPWDRGTNYAVELGHQVAQEALL